MNSENEENDKLVELVFVDGEIIEESEFTWSREEEEDANRM